jgi:hypothetical protein
MRELMIMLTAGGGGLTVFAVLPKLLASRGLDCLP